MSFRVPRVFKMLSIRKRDGKSQVVGDNEPSQQAPSLQTALLLNGPRQPYEIVHEYPVPSLQDENEVLVRTRVIGLNPIDWKAPDFNFGIPELPYVSGREISGDVIQVGKGASDWSVNDRVAAISTDYRDIRKGAYQQYVVALDYNIVRIPPSISYEQGATLGVAFVAAALGLGVSLGLNFTDILDGPDLFQLVRSGEKDHIPQDVASECFDGIRENERLKPGDWLVIWGGSATSANLTIQLAKLARVKTIVVVDVAKHGHRLSSHKVLSPDLLVDSHDPDRAVEIIQANTKGQVRFGLDTRGKETASHLLRALVAPSKSKTSLGDASEGNGHGKLPLSPPGTPEERKPMGRSHLIGMSGLPKDAPSKDVILHSVPIKLFHEVRPVGLALCQWLGRLLERGCLSPPDIVGVESGLESINSGLDRMRKGEISGGKLVVQVT